MVLIKSDNSYHDIAFESGWLELRSIQGSVIGPTLDRTLNLADDDRAPPFSISLTPILVEISLRLDI